VTWTQEQADARLLIDAARYERGIRGMVSVPLSERQLGALVSWAYNVGLDAARRSTLIRLLNAGNYAAAADQFRRWNRAGGRVMAGLSRRRAAEETLFRAGS
jgi:lysozyme